jgi:hypothetical protein
MIVDLDKFISRERPHWDRLESQLNRLEAGPEGRMPFEEVKRVSLSLPADGLRPGPDRDLRHGHLSSESILENIVGRAYSEIYTIHSMEGSPFPSLALGMWPHSRRPSAATWRRIPAQCGHSIGRRRLRRAGGSARQRGQAGANAILPPGRRSFGTRRARRSKPMGTNAWTVTWPSSPRYLMTHNTKVAILAMALGMSWGIGTVLLVFYNGAISRGRGAGLCPGRRAVFVVGWLLPHGAFEIPAILIGSQAGLVAGQRPGRPGTARYPCAPGFKTIRGDLVTLIGGVRVDAGLGRPGGGVLLPVPCPGATL